MRRSKKTTVRIPDEVMAKLQETADRRGRSLNTTIVDVLEAGFDWMRTRYQIVK